MKTLKNRNKAVLAVLMILMLAVSVMAQGITANAAVERDENGVPKEGAKYTLTYPDGTKVTVDSYEEAKKLESEWKKIYEGKTDKDGKIILKGYAKDGKIKVYEKVVPKGYTADTRETIADLKEGSVTIVNRIAKEFEKSEENKEDSETGNTDLSVIKTTAVKKAKVGDKVPYTIIVKNGGSADAKNVVVKDILHKYLGYMEDDSNGKVSGKEVTWTVDVVAGGSRTIRIDTEILEGAEGKIVNKVLIEGQGEGEEFSDNAEIEMENYKAEPEEEAESEEEEIKGSSSKSSGASGTRTGDRANIIIPVIILVAAGAVLAAVIVKRRQK